MIDDTTTASASSDDVSERRAIEERNAPALEQSAGAPADQRARADAESLHRIDDRNERAAAIDAMARSALVDERYDDALKRFHPDAADQVAARSRVVADQAILAKEERKAADMAAMRGGSDRLAKSLDERMAKSELEERGWKDRDDLADVMRDLEQLAHRDWQRAANLWDKYRPGDIDKPVFIDGDDVDDPRRPSKRSNAVDRDPKAAERDDVEAKDAEFLTPASVRKRFIQAENKFYFRDEENRLAFEDRGKRLVTEHNDPNVARSMVEVAEARGWDAIRVRGSEEFKRVAWLQGSLRGIEVDGFKPRAVDVAKLEELRAERAPDEATRASASPNRNQELVSRRQLRAEPTRETAADRGAVVDEHQRSLTEPQRQAVEALKAILRARGDSEKAVDMAADMAADRFQNNRVHVGRVLGHGQAPYENDPANAPSYFVKLQTANGEKTVWGVDLRRALDAGKADVGDDVALAYQGRQQVTVKVKERDERGTVVGETDQVVNRNTWDVNRLDSLREEVRSALTEAARKTETRQPLVKVYDRDAAREQPRPDLVREQSRRAERTR
jgi:Large polyvalent protein-associated domain 7